MNFRIFALPGLIILLGYTSLFSQQINLSVLTLPGIAYDNQVQGYFGGMGLEVSYLHPLSYGKLRAGLEFRTIDWGSQLGLNLGYNHPYKSISKWEFSGTASLQGGMALFRPKPFAVLAFDYLPKVEWITGKRVNVSLSSGIRFSINPQYRTFGIWRLWEIPVRLGIHFGVKRIESN